jgi:hypothetical protein
VSVRRKSDWRPNGDRRKNRTGWRLNAAKPNERAFRGRTPTERRTGAAGARTRVPAFRPGRAADIPWEKKAASGGWNNDVAGACNWCSRSRRHLLRLPASGAKADDTRGGGAAVRETNRAGRSRDFKSSDNHDPVGRRTASESS